MAERRKRLTAKLDEIDEHLRSEEVATDLEEPLQEAIGNVRQAVSNPSDEGHQELSESLEDLALSFEVTHPRLTALLNNLSELLSGAGI